MSFLVQEIDDPNWKLRKEIPFHQHVRMSWDQLFQELMAQCATNDDDDDDSTFTVYFLRNNVYLEKNKGFTFESRAKMTCKLAKNRLDFIDKLMNDKFTIIFTRRRSNVVVESIHISYN